MSGEDFLSRWSRRKHAERRGEPEAPATPPEPLAAVAPAPPVPEPPPPPLPPVESLTPESDFTPFMRQEVDPLLKRQALKTLFQDPRFNVMDGLDVYIDDFSKPDPLPEGWLERLNQTARLGEYRDPEEKEPQPQGEGEAAEPPPELPAAEKPIIDQSLTDGNDAPGEAVDPVEEGPRRAAGA